MKQLLYLKSIPSMPKIINESTLHQQVVNYIKYQYPKVLFRTDFAAGIKMTMGQAVKHKKLQKCKAWPDLFIAKRSCGYAGLFIEFKKDIDEVYTKKLLFKNPHVKEQAEILTQLHELGYVSCFAFGFDSAKNLIDSYLNNKL